MKFPPGGLAYGDLRDQELTKREGNRPFVFFWSMMALFAVFLILSAGSP